MDLDQLDINQYKNKIVYHPVMKAKQEDSKANSKGDNEDGMSKETKILLSLVGLAVLGGTIYYGGKKGWFGDNVKKFFNGEDNKGKVGTTSKINTDGKDNLGYEISKPKIDDLNVNDLPNEPIGKYTNNFLYYKNNPNNEYYNAEINYGLIYADLNRQGNEKTLNRYKEVVDDLSNTSLEIKNKILQDIPSLKDLATDDKYRFHYIGAGCPARGVLQKRYFSIPEKHKDGYCCLDPLLYKQAREECIDTYLGYDLLEYMCYKGHNNSPLLDKLLDRYSSTISQANKNFINNCVDKINNSQSHMCAGHNSALHAYELARLGKIFREAMGIQVK